MAPHTPEISESSTEKVTYSIMYTMPESKFKKAFKGMVFEAGGFKSEQAARKALEKNASGLFGADAYVVKSERVITVQVTRTRL